MRRLTFEDQRFILEDGNFGDITKLFDYRNAGDEWTPINPDDYSTKEIKAAARFRHLADDKASKILNRILVHFYEVPASLQLPFLDQHQIDGIKWILSRSRSYLAHAPGAGKTAQAIIASLLTEWPGQTLFIVPPGLTINWEREISFWYDRFQQTPRASISDWPSIAIVPESALASCMGWNADFIICPDSMLTKDWVLSNLKKRRFKFVAVDEASRFKESESARTIALFGGETKNFKSPGLIYDAKHVVLMDGSPMPNRAMELWAPTYAMAPETIDFMSQQDFGFKYCGAKINDWGRWEFKYTTNEAELKERLQKSFMHVVTEEQLEHPERLRSLLYMDQDPLTPEMKEWERSNLNDFSLGDDGEDQSRGELAAHRQLLGIRKVPWIAKYVKERLERKNESILLFTWHRDVALSLTKELVAFKPGLVIGGTSAEAREDWFQKFQSGETKILIGNIRAMGVGHNLQRADRVIFGEFSWTDEYNKQCEKRASRKGSTKSFVRCEYVIAPRTLDERVLGAVFTKQQKTKRVIG